MGNGQQAHSFSGTGFGFRESDKFLSKECFQWKLIKNLLSESIRSHIKMEWYKSHLLS